MGVQPFVGATPDTSVLSESLTGSEEMDLRTRGNYNRNPENRTKVCGGTSAFSVRATLGKTCLLTRLLGLPGALWS